MEVIGQASDGPTSIAMCRELVPDVVTMDVSMPGMDGIEATRRIKAQSPAVRIIGLSMHEDAVMAQQMHEAGADAYLNKACPPSALVEKIRECATPQPAAIS